MGFWSRETIVIGHHPELTKEKAVEVFSQSYQAYPVRLGIDVDFVVKKDDWNGVNIKLEQWGRVTVFKYAWYPPTIKARLILAGTIAGGWMAYKRYGKKFEEEIGSFISEESTFA